MHNACTNVTHNCIDCMVAELPTNQWCEACKQKYTTTQTTLTSLLAVHKLQDEKLMDWANRFLDLYLPRSH